MAIDTVRNSAPRDPASRGRLALALAATLLVCLGATAWPWAWTALPPGGLRDLAGALTATLLIAPLWWRLLAAPPAAAVADDTGGPDRAWVAECTTNPVLITDAQRRIVWSNEAFTRISGYDLHEVVGRSPGQLLQCVATDPEAVSRMRCALDAGNGIRLELLNRSKDGREYWIDADIQPVRDRRGVLVGFVAVHHLIGRPEMLEQPHRVEPTELQDAVALAPFDSLPPLFADGPDTEPAVLSPPERRRAPRRAVRDPLSRLPTRTEVMDRLQAAIDLWRQDPQQGFAALFLDVDRFREVNDSVGHDVGDELLSRLAQRLRQVLRPGDVAARVPSLLNSARRQAGDEFLVLLDGAGEADEVRSVAERLLFEMSLPLKIGAQVFTPSLSIGIVTAEQAADTAEAVLRDCDSAMIEAKRAGRGRAVFFDAALRERVDRSLALEDELRHALQQGELFLLYQPMIELDSHQLVGVEALLRWQHPQRDVLPPSEFIGMAEECGLADAICDFVLGSACRQFARWRRELGVGAPAMVAVNLPASQLLVAGMVQEIEALLADNGMQPHELQIDVADGVQLQQRPVLAVLQALKKLGVRLAIDDFGGGSSSLAGLHQMPVDTVKIDPSFVARAHQVEHHRVLIEATVRVAASRGMTVLAEGIETPAQAALMLRMGCGQAQGWFYGTAMPAAELAQWEAPPLAAAIA